MGRTAIILACLIGTGALGCGESPTEILGRVELTSNKTTYQRGERVIVTIRNNAGSAVYVNPCYADLQHRASSGWTAVAGGGCWEINLQGLLKLQPGEVTTVEQQTGIFPVGEYRMVFDIRIDTRLPATAEPDLREPLAASNIFLLQH